MVQGEKKSLVTCAVILLMVLQAATQSILPPLIPWKGKSESLVAGPGNPWITTAEKSNFRSTPDYYETMSWFKRLSEASPVLRRPA